MNGPWLDETGGRIAPALYVTRLLTRDIPSHSCNGPGCRSTQAYAPMSHIFSARHTVTFFRLFAISYALME